MQQYKKSNHLSGWGFGSRFKDFTGPRCLYSGYSLIHMLLVLAIVGTLMAVSFSGFNTLIEQQRSYAAMQQFRSLFKFARYTAVAQTKIVTVCAITAAQKCTRHWTEDLNIAVFIDTNRNHRLDDDETLLRLLSWPLDRGSIIWRASLARPYIDFQTTGNTWQNGSLFYCPVSRNNRFASALVLSHSGRSYEPGDSDKNGIKENRLAKDLEC